MVTDEQQWYVQSGSRVQGPFSTVEVGRYLLLGRVRSNDRVSKDGELWEPVTQVPELIPEELLDLESDQGWSRYMVSHEAIDERETSATTEVVERRVVDTRQARETIRQEWRQQSLVPAPRKTISSLPLVLLGVTLIALLFVIYLNVMTSAPI